MGIQTIMECRSIYYLAWGEGEAKSVRKMVEGKVDETNPSSYLQNHTQTEVIIDRAASAELTRIATPWLTGPCAWTEELDTKLFSLCRHLDKPILKLTARDYNDNGMSDLITERGPFSKINIDTFNFLQHSITGWPGENQCRRFHPSGKGLPYPKRVIVFSPHPDDDVISMGGTVARLSDQGHVLHIAYHTSGNIAVLITKSPVSWIFCRKFLLFTGWTGKNKGNFEQARKDMANKRNPENRIHLPSAR